MQPTVDPTQTIATHHILLSDEAASPTQLGLILLDASGIPDARAITEQANPRTALKVSSGGGGMTDYEMPYQPLTQSDFSGGMGQEHIEEDATKYFDCNLVDTSQGKIIPAGDPTYTIGQGDWTRYPYTGTVTSSSALSGNLNGLYCRFVAGVTGTCNMLFSANTSARQTSLDVIIYNDNAGALGSTILAQTKCKVNENISEAFATLNYAFTSGTAYWLYIKNTAPGAIFLYAPHITVGTVAKTGTHIYDISTAVLSADHSISFALIPHQQGRCIYFEYRRGLYKLVTYQTGAPKLYMNGFRGAVVAGTTNSTIKTGVTMTGNYFTGSVLVVISGPGSDDEKPYRTIIGNTTTGDVNVSPPFDTTPTASSQYVIVGSNNWDEIGSHGLTARVTDVCVIDNYVYFCQGADANLRRMTYTTSYAYADEGVKRDQIQAFTDSDGKKRVFSTVNATSLVYKADISSGSALSWTQVNNSLPVGNGDSRINTLAVYSDPQMPYIIKEDGFGSIASNANGNTADASIYAPIPIGDEMRAVRNENNGLAWVQSNTFLFFGLGEGIERYYQGSLDDVGPDRGYGLPFDRKGQPRCMVAYPGGRIYASIDAGDAKYSSVLLYNRSGWCEIYRAFGGMRINSLYIQQIPGVQYQRLWIGMEENSLWIPIAKNPLRADGFQFATDCEWTSSWIYTSYKTIQKMWNSLRLFTVNASVQKTVTAYYRTDNNTAWTALGSTFTTSPTQEIELNAHATNVSLDVTGTRIQFRLMLHTNDASTPVYVEQVVVEAVVRVPAKKAWTITALVSDYGTDLTGTMSEAKVSGTSDTKSGAQIKAILDGWADSRVRPGRILMRSLIEPFDAKKVLIEPGSYQVLEHIQNPQNPRTTKLKVQMTLIEG